MPTSAILVDRRVRPEWLDRRGNGDRPFEVGDIGAREAAQRSPGRRARDLPAAGAA